jgi:hypothetical protein
MRLKKKKKSIPLLAINWKKKQFSAFLNHNFFKNVILKMIMFKMIFNLQNHNFKCNLYNFFYLKKIKLSGD